MAMSDLSKEQVKELSRLARIELSEEEAEKLTHDLKRVVDYIEQLEQVDVSDISPTTHLLEEQGLDTFRADEIGEVLPRKTFLDNAPDQVGGMVRVPPVMKGH